MSYEYSSAQGFIVCKRQSYEAVGVGLRGGEMALFWVIGWGEIWGREIVATLVVWVNPFDVVLIEDGRRLGRGVVSCYADVVL